MNGIKKIWLIWLLFICANSKAQNCPPNIGFENGTLDNWACTAGFILSDGTLSLAPTAPIFGRHTIFANSYPQQLDPYGNFPVNCPNGSKYSIRLGNSQAGGQAEGISYTFTIPANQNSYSITYNYAVVLQNPPHLPYQQPRFTSNVFNVSDNTYIDCASFQFIAAANLPGFSAAADSVFYKPWSPVTVNLSGLAGKTVRLEFTTNDCAFVKHFGYAYIDVNEDCGSSPISGNVYCGGAKDVTLTAPFGFATYNWFNSDFSQLLGTGNTLTISPAPPANTNYNLAITPYPGQGCADTLHATIQVSAEPFNLVVKDSITGCSSAGVDLTSTVITAGSTPGLVYSYYTDPNELNYVPVPSKITTSGVYYVKGENTVGCHDIQPIKVLIRDAPTVIITDPEAVCSPNTIDITSTLIIAGSEPGLTYSYWKDPAATIVLASPNAVTKGGVYYIEGTTDYGCSSIQPVRLKIGTIPTVITHNVTGCEKVNLTNPGITSGSTGGLTYTFWVDPSATVSLLNANDVTSSGTYFIRAASDSGCVVIAPVSVTINPLPFFTVTDPQQVVYPVMTVDITSSVSQNIGLNFSYWLDSLARFPLNNPTAVDKRGVYYIKGTNEYGCSVIEPVNVKIIPPPAPIVYAPNAFTPNNDGLNDVFKIKIIGETTINHLRIYTRWGQVIYDDPDLNHSWDGKFKGSEMPIGVYIWTIDGVDTYYQKRFSQNGTITLVR